MYPTRYDHDDALKACQKIRASGILENDNSGRYSPEWAISILNIVAGAYACNQKAYCSYSDFTKALEFADK